MTPENPPRLLRRVRTWLAESWLAYGAFQYGRLFALSLPPRAAQAVARGLGRAFHAFAGSRRRTVRENLRVAFGREMGEAEREALARRTFEHVFTVAMEILWRPRIFQNLRAAERRCGLAGDEAAMRADIRAGRGGLVLTAHFGNWELAGTYLRLERVPFTAVARPMDNPWMERFATDMRGGSDGVIGKQGAVRGVLRALEAGRWVGILADQNAGRHGVFVPFFGLPASTYPFGAAVAVRYGLPVYFGAAVRRGGGFRYDVVVKRYDVAPTADPEADARRLLEAFHAQLETWIRSAPEQYLWMHRRWRSRPPGEPVGPHLPVYDRRAGLRRRLPVSSAAP